jgi:hypothetical protein
MDNGSEQDRFAASSSAMALGGAAEHVVTKPNNLNRLCKFDMHEFIDQRQRSFRHPALLSSKRPDLLSNQTVRLDPLPETRSAVLGTSMIRRSCNADVMCESPRRRMGRHPFHGGPSLILSLAPMDQVIDNDIQIRTTTSQEPLLRRHLQAVNFEEMVIGHVISCRGGAGKTTLSVSKM